MTVIFCASTNRFSFENTSGFITPVIHWLLPGLSEEGIHLVNMLVRKAAHLTEYGILAVLLWRAIRNIHISKNNFWSWRDARWTLLIVALYAASDEFHQSFVPSRDASLRDVLIDCAGALLALLCLWSLRRWRESR